MFLRRSGHFYIDRLLEPAKYCQILFRSRPEHDVTTRDSDLWAGARPDSNEVIAWREGRIGRRRDESLRGMLVRTFARSGIGRAEASQRRSRAPAELVAGLPAEAADLYRPILRTENAEIAYLVALSEFDPGMADCWPEKGRSSRRQRLVERAKRLDAVLEPADLKGLSIDPQARTRCYPNTALGGKDLSVPSNVAVPLRDRDRTRRCDPARLSRRGGSRVSRGCWQRPISKT